MAVEVFKGLLGDKIINGEGEAVQFESFCGKDGSVVGLYFSAHWCPPCRGFTPKLSEFYKNLKGKDFEIIFVSSDRDEASFKDYFKEMPWLALPFSNRDTKAALSSKYKVQGIPTLVLLNGVTGEIITTKARDNVANDSTGENFPWYPKSLTELLKGASYVEKDETKTGLYDHLQGKITGLYFSAHWCPPCRGFTPTLCTFYNKMKESGRNDFEIVFVSSDRDESSFKEYFSEMPWIGLPFSDRTRKSELSQHFEVGGIPTLVFLDKDFKTITTNGRAKVAKDPEGKEFPWPPRPLNPLDEEFVDNVNNEPCLVVFTDEEKEEELKNAIEDVAKKEFEKKTDHVTCLYAIQGEQWPDRLREHCKLGDSTCMAIIDMPSQKKYVCEDFTDPGDKAKIEAFLQQYHDKKLTAKNIQE